MICLYYIISKSNYLFSSCSECSGLFSFPLSTLLISVLILCRRRQQGGGHSSGMPPSAFSTPSLTANRTCGALV